MTEISNIIVYSDTHIGAPHAKLIDSSEIVDEFKNKSDNTLLLATGDIFDIRNTKRKKVQEKIRERDDLKELLGKYYIFGNHECSKDPDGAYFYIENNIMWLHYHLPDWCGSFEDPCSKVINWENKKHGLSRLRYLAYRLSHLVLRKGVKWKPNDSEIKKITEFAKSHGCKIVIFGHTHKLYDKPHEGIRIINAGRGRTSYEI